MSSGPLTAAFPSASTSTRPKRCSKAQCCSPARPTATTPVSAVHRAWPLGRTAYLRARAVCVLVVVVVLLLEVGQADGERPAGLEALQLHPVGPARLIRHATPHHMAIPLTSARDGSATLSARPRPRRWADL
jgi:hypothetical protein